MKLEALNKRLATRKPFDKYVPNVTNEDYHACDALGHSALKPMRESPAKWKWAQDHPFKQTAAQALGTLIHEAVLEPDLFEAKYAVAAAKPKKPERPESLKGLRRNSKKADCPVIAWENEVLKPWEEQCKRIDESVGEKTPISQDDMIVCERIYNTLHRDPFLSKFVGKGIKEQSFFHLDEETDLWLKARPDTWLADSEVIIDLKTCNSAAAWEFNNDITKWSYHTQAALYADVVAAVTGAEPAVVILAVEKGRDNDVNTFFIDREELALARKIYRSWLTRLRECLDSNSFPGYERKFIKYQMPEWQRRLYEEEEE